MLLATAAAAETDEIDSHYNEEAYNTEERNTCPDDDSLWEDSTDTLIMFLWLIVVTAYQKGHCWTPSSSMYIH